MFMVYKFRKMVGKNNLPYDLKQLFFVIKRLVITQMFSHRSQILSTFLRVYLPTLAGRP